MRRDPTDIQNEGNEEVRKAHTAYVQFGSSELNPPAPEPSQLARNKR